MLLKNLLSDKDAQIGAVVAVIQKMHPDILLLNDFDHDHAGLALAAFRQSLGAGERGIDYPYSFAPAGNSGFPTGRDLDGNGADRDREDAIGFGRFPGNEGMALLSRFPLVTEKARSFDRLIWRDRLPLTSKSLWDVPVVLPNEDMLHILATHTTPPVFDGPDNRNGLRNAAEIGFWLGYLGLEKFQDDKGTIAAFTDEEFILLGDLNNDPENGEGLKPPLLALLAHPRLRDPVPRSETGSVSTVDWGPRIGKMRVDYVLPARSLHVVGAGVYWPSENTEAGVIVKTASHHKMVWVDVEID